MAPNPNPEVYAVIEAQRAAQARLALVAAYLSSVEWSTVPAIGAGAAAAQWAETSLRIIYALRIRSKRVAKSGYQLARALDSGYTLGLPRGRSAATKQVTLGELRELFMEDLLDIATIDSEPGSIDDPDIRWVEEVLQLVDPAGDESEQAQIFQATDLDPYIQNLLDRQGSDDDVRITIEPHDWGDDMTLEEVEEEFKEPLLDNAVGSQEDFIEGIRKEDTLTFDEALTKIEQHNITAGSLGTAIVDAAVMDAARSSAIRAATRDRRVKLVARGTGPNPCAFCAMLASRGFVYSSETTAGGKNFGGGQEEIEKFHKNCHCYPIIRWTTVAVELPPLSQFLHDMWPEVTDGYSGVDALNAWRRWLYRKRKEGFQFPSNINT